MTTQGFITAEEIKEGKKGFDVFSVVSILASYAPELAEKIRTLNAWYSGTTAEFDTESGQFAGVTGNIETLGVGASSQKTRLTQVAENFSAEDASDLIIEISNNIISDPYIDLTDVTQSEIVFYVGENLFKDWNFDLGELNEETGQWTKTITNRTVIPAEKLSVTKGPEWHDIALSKINIKTDESLRDPSTLLMEDKLRIALDSVQEDGVLGADGVVIRRMILEPNASNEDLGISEADRLRLEKTLAGTDEVPGVVDTFKTSVHAAEIEFTKPEGKGNFGPWFTAKVDKNPVVYFGNIVKAPKLGGIDYREFNIQGVSDNPGNAFKDVINDWIDETEDGNSNAEGLTGDAKKATMETNRIIIKQAQKALKGYVDSEGNITDFTKNAALSFGTTPEMYVAQKVYDEAIGSNFVEDENGVTKYEETRSDKKAVFDAAALSGNVSAQNKALETLLREDDSFWIVNETGAAVAITSANVSEQAWLNWRHYYLNNGPEATKAFVKPQLQQAVDSYRGTTGIDPSNLRASLDESQPPTPPSGIASLPAFRLSASKDADPPIFDETIFDTEVNKQWGEERPEFAAYLKHELKTSDFKDRYLKQANPQPREDRGADLELQQDRFDQFQKLLADAQAAYNANPSAQNLQSLESAKSQAERAEVQYRRETGQTKFALVPPKEGADDPYQYGVSDKLIDDPTLTEEERLATYYAFIRQATPEKPITETERLAALEKAEKASGKMMPQYEEFFGKPGEQKSPTEYKEFLTKTPESQSEFLKSKIPGFEKRYKESDFYKAEQERLAKTGSDEAADEATRKRRQQLRTLNTGRSIFTRARR